jgi:hypothetical protein
MTPLVFISHSSQDRRIALRVCEALERLNLGCWLASRDIGPGDNFQEAIVRAIRTARVMVLIFTGNANNSDEIKKEIALASQHHLGVIPVRAEDVAPSDAFLYELSTRQWVDAFDDWDRAMRRLADQIAELAGQQPTAAPLDGGRASRRRRMAIGLAAAAAVALVVAAGLAHWLGERAPAPTAPVASTAPSARAPGVTSNITGTWVSDPLTSPYDQNHKSVLRFEFEQSGDAVLGTVSEKAEFGGSTKGIRDGQVKGDSVVFYTQGVTTAGSGEQPYKENYHGTVKGDVIEFVRQNDVATGGLLEKFIAKRE